MAYAANVTLTAASGYHFASDAAVNVTGAVIENLTVSTESEGNTLSFRAVFAATDTAQNTQQQEQPSAEFGKRRTKEHGKRQYAVQLVLRQRLLQCRFRIFPRYRPLRRLIVRFVDLGQ